MICDGNSTKSQGTFSGERANGNAAQRVVQQMAEFMENGFHFAMSQQRRRVADRRRQVPANQTQVRLAFIRIAGDERIHPGAAALVFARKPIGVEAAEQMPDFASSHDNI